MKKLIMAIAVVACAAVASAASFDWKTSATGKFYEAGTTTLLANGTAYLFDASAISQQSVVDYFIANGSLIAGALYSGAFFFTYLALGCGSFAISMLVLSYSLVFSVAYGIFFLGENASAFVWVGLVLVMISLFLMREKWDGTQQHIHPKWLICIGLAFLGNGLFGVVTRMQQIAYRDAATNEFMVLALGFSFAALLLLGLLKSPSDFPYAVRHGLPYAMGAGACNGMTNLVALLLVSGLFGMPVSVTSAIRAGAKTVLSFLFSVFLLRERFEKRQVVGVLFGVVAIVFLNMQ